MRRSSRRIEFSGEPRMDVGNAAPSIDLPTLSPLVELVAAATGARKADADAVTLALSPARDACATTGPTSTASDNASQKTPPRTTPQRPVRNRATAARAADKSPHMGHRYKPKKSAAIVE